MNKENKMHRFIHQEPQDSDSLPRHDNKGKNGAKDYLLGF
jgi:hypothetical protein